MSAGQPYRIFGAAWAGESEVTSVEVRTDGDQAWQTVYLLDEAILFAWRPWEFTGTPPAALSHHLLQARANDRAGRSLPTTPTADTI